MAACGSRWRGWWRISGGPGLVPAWDREYVGSDGPDH